MYDEHQILRGLVLIDTIPGSATSYEDPNAPLPLANYDVVSSNSSGSNERRCTFWPLTGTMRATDATGSPGQAVEIRIVLDDLTTVANGWSLGFRHDGTQLSLIGVENGATTQTVNNGAPPDFQELTLDAGSCDPPEPDGFTVGVVINFTGAADLPPGTDYELYLVEYEILAPAPATAIVDFSFDLGCPPYAVVLVHSGASLIPAMRAGRIQIEELSFIRGDANDDGQVDLADPVLILDVLFGDGSMGCEVAADANQSDVIDVADPVYLLNYLFIDGPEPPAPFPSCGVGFSSLSCVSYVSCP
jgi:hypothetical protein